MAQRGDAVQESPRTSTQTLQEAPRVLQAPPRQDEVVTLVLRPRKKVSWKEETVDNEHMQKKSSKICCVFHKKDTLDDSGSDDDNDHDCGHAPHPAVNGAESSKRSGE